MSKLNGAVCVVTGGARGIGQAALRESGNTRFKHPMGAARRATTYQPASQFLTSAKKLSRNPALRF